MKAATLGALSATCLALAGCATPGRDLIAESSKALASAPVCCQSLGTAKRAALPTQAKPVDVAIDVSAQAFDFGGNKAFFVLYELPAFKETYSVVVTSVAQGTLQDGAMFIPRIATYD